MTVELDPRWEWVNIQGIGDPVPVYVKGACRHLRVIPVETLEGTEVAQLCLTCDAQFPPSKEASA